MSFEAKYRSLCMACDEYIRPGQRAQYEDGEVVHASCDLATPEAMMALGTPCEKCWQVPSISGACGCDDDSPEWTI